MARRCSTVGVVGPNADVQRIVVIQHAHFGAVACRLFSRGMFSMKLAETGARCQSASSRVCHPV